MAWTVSVASRESYVAQSVADRQFRPGWVACAVSAVLNRAKSWVGGTVHQPRSRQFAKHQRAQSSPITPKMRRTADRPHRGSAVALPDPDQLTARISHDLRTPLNAVIGFSELMHLETRERDPDCRYRDYADRIRQSGEALLKATEETLVMTQMIAAAAKPQRQASARSFSIAGILERAGAAKSTAACDEMTLAGLRATDPQVEGCEAAYREAFNRLIACFDAASPERRHTLDVQIVDDELLVSLHTPGGCTDTMGHTQYKRSAGTYPLDADTLGLFIVQTMFALQGAEMSWVTGRSGEHLTARILIPMAAQWSLPLEPEAGQGARS